MPTMWFAKDGPRPNSQNTPGRNVTPEEAEAIVQGHSVHFVGPEPPSINPDTPSNSEKNVVFEIEVESQSSRFFPKIGFYLIHGMHPAQALDALKALRKK